MVAPVVLADPVLMAPRWGAALVMVAPVVADPAVLMAPGAQLAELVTGPMAMMAMVEPLRALPMVVPAMLPMADMAAMVERRQGAMVAAVDRAIARTMEVVPMGDMEELELAMVTMATVGPQDRGVQLFRGLDGA